MLHISQDIYLKKLDYSHTLPMFEAINTQRTYLGQWLPFVAFTRQIDDTEAFVREVVQTQDASGDLVFAILKSNEFAGLIGFKGTDRMNKKTEIGYWLSEPFQGQGIMTRCVEHLCAYAFHHMDMNRIQIRCAVENVQSRRIPERLNFMLEGVERAGERMADQNFVDLAVYSKLRTDH